MGDDLYTTLPNMSHLTKGKNVLIVTFFCQVLSQVDESAGCPMLRTKHKPVDEVW